MTEPSPNDHEKEGRRVTSTTSPTMLNRVVNILGRSHQKTTGTCTSGSYAVVATNSCGSDTSVCEDMIVGITDLDLEQISIYPNPSNGQFVIRSTNILVGDASIFDASGRLIKTVPLNAKENPINMLGSYPGIYFTKIKGDNFNKSIRFIIQ